MTPERIQRLIAKGESLDVEFKGEKRGPLSDDDLVDAVVCLANRSSDTPAWLLIGVEDDGRITGARSRHESGRTDPMRLAALIANRTRPSLTPRISVVPLQGKEVIAIEVPPMPAPVGTTGGKYLRRAIGGDGKPCCLPMFFHEMHARQADRGAEDYSALVIPDATWDDLDPLEFERFRRSIRERRTGDQSLLALDNLELAKALGAVEANGQVRSVRVLGLVLFGKEDSLRRLLPTHEVAFQVLAGQKVEVNDFFQWPLLRVMEECEQRFAARTREQEIMVGFLRVAVPDYPLAAFREALANALIHRDYTRLGAVHVQWHADRLQISNPGGFPEGVRLDNLLVTAPRPRNPLLTAAWASRPPTSASAASNPSSRNRWCCNTWKNTGGLPERRHPNSAGSVLTRHTASLSPWREEGYWWRAARKKDGIMSAARNITTRGYPITTRANNTAVPWACDAVVIVSSTAYGRTAKARPARLISLCAAAPLPAQSAKLDAATCLRQAQRGRQVAGNLKDLGYGV